VALHYLLYAGIHNRNVTLDIVLPELALNGKLLIAQAILLPTHGDEAGVKVFDEILLQCTDSAGAVFVQKELKTWMVYGSGGIYRSVVMVENKAFILHHISPNLILPSITQSLPPYQQREAPFIKRED
jgi:hypothetical protein